MTMKLKITNEDATRTARLIQLDQQADGSWSSPVSPSGDVGMTDIPPGTSAEVYVWDTREFRLVEVDAPGHLKK